MYEVSAVLPGVYVGQVTDTNDPDNLGRVKASVASVFFSDEEEISVWARPCFPPGQYCVPDMNDAVWIAFENGDPGNAVWLGIWYPANKTPQEAKPVSTRLIRTAKGHLILLDDSDGNESVIVRHRSGGEIEISGEKITLKSASGDHFELSSFKSFMNGLLNVFQAWTPSPQDGGAALKLAMVSFLASQPLPM